MMSVVTLLSAVSGTVFLVSDQGAESAVASVQAPSDSAIAVGGGFGLVDEAEKAEQRAHAEKVTDRAQVLAKAEAKAEAKVEAAAERKQIRERASRSARRDPQALARIMVADHGWSSGQFSCLKALWTRESGWNYRATNPSSGAYGIVQALPARKMASAGSDWRTNPVTQMKWGLDYIADRYGSPCGAWAHSESTGWY